MLFLTSTATFFIFLALPRLGLADEKPCTIHDGDSYYDLNPLKASKDYQFRTEGGHDFYLNVCRGVTTDTWNINLPDVGDVAGFIRKDHGDLSIGTVNTTLEMKEGAVTMRLSQGSKCANSDELASAVVRFLCNNSVYGAGKPALIDQYPNGDENACHFDFEWHTNYACPVGERGLISGILIFIVILAIVGMMMFIVGSTVYNRFVLKRRGFDQLPQFSLSQVFEMLSICGEFISEGIARGIDKIRTTRPRGLNSFSHHWNARNSGSTVDGGSGREFFRATTTREEEGMLDSHEDEESGRELHNVHDASVWGADHGSRPDGMDPQGVIKL